MTQPGFAEKDRLDFRFCRIKQFVDQSAVDFIEDFFLKIA